MDDSSSRPTGKRKRPPTFQHYPVDRAKKLKKAWVEKTKTKSKWKTQKKKEGLAASSKLDFPVYDEEEGDHDAKDNDSDLPVLPTGEQPCPHLHPSRAHNHPELPVKHSKARISDTARPAKKQKMSKEDSQHVESPSLRQLKREAYSPSALHTFKSDPLKKRDKSRSGGESRRKERGQPNMKLRMNAMLEKIKQNFT